MNWKYWATFSFLTVLFAMLLASATFPPITDLPQHLAQIRLLEELLGFEATIFDRSNYQINWLAPNTLVYLPLWFLTVVFDTLTAGKLAMFLLAVSWSFTIVYLAAKRNLPVSQAILASVFILNLSFYWGFINFLFAFPFFILWVAWNTPDKFAELRGSHIVTNAVFLMILLWAHSLWFVLAAVWYGLIIAYVSKYRKICFKQIFLWLLALVPVCIISVLWFPQLRSDLAESGYRVMPVWHTYPWDRLGIYELPNALLGGLQGGLENTVVLLVFAWIALCIYTNWGRLSVTTDKVLGLCACLLWTVFLLAPDFYTNTMLFNQRFAAPAIILTLLSLPAPKLVRLVNLIPAVIFGAFLLATTLTWKAYDDTELTGLVDSINTVPQDKCVMWLSFEQSPRFKNPVFLQIGALTQAMSGSELNFSFAELGTGLVALEKQRRVVWTRNLEWRPQTVNAKDIRLFDYILVNGREGVHARFREIFDVMPVTSNGRFILYRPTEPVVSKNTSRENDCAKSF